MNENWEELLLKTRSAINREKYLASVTSRQKAADAALKPAFYVGKDPHSHQELVQINGGNPIVAKSVTNGQIKPGDAVQPIQSLGSYSINALPHIPLKEVEEEAPKVKKGDGRFKVLFSKVKDGIRTFYVGGHTKKPVKAFSIPVAQLPYNISAFIGNTGMGKYDFTIDYYYVSDIPDTSTTPPGKIVLKGYYTYGQEGLREVSCKAALYCGYGFWGSVIGGDLGLIWQNNTRNNSPTIVTSGTRSSEHEGGGTFSSNGSSSGEIKKDTLYRGVVNRGAVAMNATESGSDDISWELTIASYDNGPFSSGASYTSNSKCVFTHTGVVTANCLIAAQINKERQWTLNKGGTIRLSRYYQYGSYFNWIRADAITEDFAGSRISNFEGSLLQPQKNELKGRRAIYQEITRTIQASSGISRSFQNVIDPNYANYGRPGAVFTHYGEYGCGADFGASRAATYAGNTFLQTGLWWTSTTNTLGSTTEYKFGLANNSGDEIVYDRESLDQEAQNAINNEKSQLILTQDNISRIFWPNIDNNAILSADSTGIARVWNVSGGMAREEDREGIIYSLGLSQTDNYTIHYISYYPEDAI